MRLIPILALVACSSTVEPEVEPADEPAATEAEPTTEAPEPEAAATNPADLIDREELAVHFAGAQVVGGTRPVAWLVEGSKVTIDDGSGAQERELSFTSPCTVKVSNPEAGSSTISVFIRDGDTRYQGLGGGAVAVGEDSYFACAGGKFAWLQGETCTGWKLNLFDRWADDPNVECRLEGEVLHVGSYELNKVGNAYLTTQLAGAEVQRHDDFAAAQAAVAQ